MGRAGTAGETRPTGSAALIGRDREIRQLIELLDAMAPGRPSVLVIEGRLGSGRTRLLDEFAAVGRRRGAMVVPESEWISAAGAGRILYTMYRRSDTLLFVCDRPQRIDPRVWTILDLLAESTPVLVVMTARTGTDPLPAGHLVSPEVHRIRLAPLSPGDVERFTGLLLAGRPSADLLNLSRVAAGHPAAVRELIAGLQEEGLVRVVAGRAVLATVRLPGRTRSRLSNQLAAMSPQARHLLQAATTLRSPFPLVRLTRLLQVSPVMLLPAIDEVLESGLLTGDNEMLKFSHELVRSVVESSMPRPVVAALRDEQSRPGRRSGPAGLATPHPLRAAATAGPNVVPARRAVDWSLLTAREREIADLVGRALTNGQIASRVGLSPHTVNYHLRQIFQKFGLTSRVELASLMRAELPATDPSSS